MTTSDGDITASDISSGLSSLGGVSEVLAFRDDAHALGDIYFDYYFPTGTEGQLNAFRHAFVSGMFAMEANADFVDQRGQSKLKLS